MSPTDDDPPSRLRQLPTWLLSEASLHAHRLLTEALASAGARGYHYRILAALEEFGPASQAVLGRRTGIDRSDVVATINDLVSWRYAQRTPDRQDRRRNVITVTPAGLDYYRRLDQLLVEVQDVLLDPLSHAERRRLVQFLNRILRSPSEHSGSTTAPAKTAPEVPRRPRTSSLK
jgi:MarR family transcriptional regulator, lower aerobic nicotinate degradation pathway regulator